MKVCVSKKILSPFLFLVLFVTAQSQPSIQWQRAYGSTGNDEANFIQPTSDGGYIMIGSESFGGGDVAGGLAPSRDGDNYWVVKLSSAGAIQWRRSLGGTNTDIGYFIQQTTDGGYILCGETFSTQNVNPFNNSDLTQPNKGQNDFWVVKLTDAGAISWEKNYGGSSSELANCIQQTSDGGYIIAGYTQSTNGDITNYIGGGSDAWIVKINSTGNIEWQKNYGGNLLDYAQSIVQTSDGGYILAGFSNSTTGNVSSPKGDHDYWVIKLTSTGAIEWQKNYGGSGNDRAYSIKQTTDGGYVVFGTSNSSNGDKTDLNGNLWVVKISSTGNISWNKSYGSGEGRCIQQTTDGGYIIAGQVFGGFGVTGVHNTSSSTTTDMWIAKLNATGNLTWQKSLGGFDTEYGRSVWPTSDGGYIACGTTRSANDGDVTNNHTSSFLPTDCWVIKLSSPALPTSLLAFSGEVNNGRVMLQWQIGVTTNLAYTEVESSSNGQAFLKITKVLATSNNKYTFIDSLIDSPMAQSNSKYYRLKMVNDDGSFTYSNILYMKLGSYKNNIALINNPIKNGQLRFQLQNSPRGQYVVNVYNKLGQKISAKTLHHEKEKTEILLLGALAAGQYYLIVSGKNLLETKTFLVN